MQTFVASPTARKYQQLQDLHGVIFIFDVRMTVRTENVKVKKLRNFYYLTKKLSLDNFGWTGATANSSYPQPDNFPGINSFPRGRYWNKLP